MHVLVLKSDDLNENYRPSKLETYLEANEAYIHV